MRQIAIDPGAEGAVAWLDGNGLSPRVAKMPDDEVKLWALFRALANVGDATALIEHQHNMAPPTQRVDRGKVVKTQGRGSKANWSLSANYNQIRMALVAAAIPFDTVSAMTWQKEFGLVFRGPNRKPYHVKKRLHVAKCCDVWRGVNVTAATADALLLLEYSRRRLGLFGADPPF